MILELGSIEGIMLTCCARPLFPFPPILGDPGADSGDEGKSKRAEKYGTKKSKERREELFSPFFTFLRTIFFRPFRISLAPTICPWVSEDVFLPMLASNLDKSIKKPFQNRNSKSKGKGLIKMLGTAIIAILLKTFP